MDDDVRHDIEMIASFDEDEIGSRMTTNCIIIRENLTVKQAMNSLVEQAAKNDNISTIFVVTESQKFYGGPDHCPSGQVTGRFGSYFLSVRICRRRY